MVTDNEMQVSQQEQFEAMREEEPKNEVTGEEVKGEKDSNLNTSDFVIYGEMDEVGLVFENEIYDIFFTETDRSPQVKLQCCNHWVTFIIDTGAPYSFLTREQVALMNLEIKRDRFGEEIVTSCFQGFGRSVPKECAVSSGKYNILGLITLRNFCCVIDLSAQKLIFRKTIKPPRPRHMTFPVEINGHTQDVVLDTGNESCFCGNYEDGVRLGLNLIDVTPLQRIYYGFDYTAILQYAAIEFPAKVFGREISDGFYKVRPTESGVSDMAVGMRYLEGLVITFNEDGTCTVTDPKQNDSTPTTDYQSSAIESGGAPDSE